MNIARRQSYDGNHTHRSCSQESDHSYHQYPRQINNNSQNVGHNLLNFNHLLLTNRKAPQKQPIYSQRNSSSTYNKQTLNIKQDTNNKQNILRKLSMIENISQIKVNNDHHMHSRRNSAMNPLISYQPRTPQHQHPSSLQHQQPQQQNYCSNLMRSSSQKTHHHQPNNNFNYSNVGIGIGVGGKVEEIGSKGVDERILGIIGRLDKIQKEIGRINKKNGGNVKTSDHQLQEIKEIYVMLRDNKKNQAKINDENYLEVQKIKQSIQSINLKLQKNKLSEFASMLTSSSSTSSFTKSPSLSSLSQSSTTTIEQSIKSFYNEFKALQTEMSTKLQKLQENYKSEKQRYQLDTYFYRKETLKGSQIATNSNTNSNTYNPSSSTSSYTHTHTHTYSDNLSSFTKKNTKVPIQKCTQITAEQSFIDLHGNKININEIIYYVDQNGYLLDANRYYIVNHKNQCIKLTNQQIQIFRGKSLVGIRA